MFNFRNMVYEVLGPLSFEDIEIDDGIVYNIYSESCDKRGLLVDDSQWDETL